VQFRRSFNNNKLLVVPSSYLMGTGEIFPRAKTVAFVHLPPPRPEDKERMVLFLHKNVVCCGL
jgi:hypothetical protein